MERNLRANVSRFIRWPLLHFLLIGAVMGILYDWLGERDADPSDRTIRITAADINGLTAQWQARWSRSPTPEELDGVVQAQIREIVLYREALIMGLDEGDLVVRRVLGQKLEGFARDLVELSLSPTVQDLETYFAEHEERYRPAPLITFTHVFIDPDLREDRTLDDAAEILAELQSLEHPTESIESYGDPFMLQRYYPEKTEQRIQSLFGSGFKNSILELPEGQWHGPVLSGYGTHLVYINARVEFPVPAFSEVKDRVTQDWVEEKRREITDQYFANILARYDVIVEREPTDGQVEALSARAP